MDQFAVHDIFGDDFAIHMAQSSVTSPTVPDIHSHNGTGYLFQTQTNVDTFSDDFKFLVGGSQYTLQSYQNYSAVSTSSLVTPATTWSSNSILDHKSSLFDDQVHTTPSSNVFDEPVLSEPNQQPIDSGDYTDDIENGDGLKDNEPENETQEQEHKEELPDLSQMTTINNVVCIFNTRCHLNLKKLATEGFNVIHKRENNVVNFKLRTPKASASIWSSGKITCTGTESEEASHTAARRIARLLQKLGFRVRFSSYKVVNVLGTSFFPFAISLNEFSAENKGSASYEPELHPAVTYKLKIPKATLKIFSTGSITVTAPSVANIHAALQHIYPLARAHRLEKGKLNPREIELAQKYIERTETSGIGSKNELKQAYSELKGVGKSAGASVVSSRGSGRSGVHSMAPRKSGYQQFRYTRRVGEEEEEDSFDSESSCYDEDESD